MKDTFLGKCTADNILWIARYMVGKEASRLMKSSVRLPKFLTLDRHSKVDEQ